MIARDLYNYSGPETTLTLTGYVKEADGGGGAYRVQSSKPTGALERIAVPTADGKWAVPLSTPTAPPRGRSVQSSEDMIARGFTYRDEGGKDLIWEGTGRQGPLWGGVPVHRRYQKPYPITCSHFTGMLMMGWAYSDTTYVRDTPRVSGWYIPLGGLGAVKAEIWQAHRQARFFFRRGDLWLTDGSDLERGDIVFFSEQNPEKQNANVKAGKADAYWGNVFHVAQYLGGGMLLQAATPTSPTGVYETPLSGYLKNTLTWAARPAWAPPPMTEVSVWDGEKELDPEG